MASPPLLQPRHLQCRLHGMQLHREARQLLCLRTALQPAAQPRPYALPSQAWRCCPLARQRRGGGGRLRCSPPQQEARSGEATGGAKQTGEGVHGQGGAPQGGDGSLVTVSALFYGAMTVAALALGEAGGTHVWAQLRAELHVGAVAGFLALFVGMLFALTALEDHLPAVAELNAAVQKLMLPQLKATPAWGLVVLALGAGVGEEALFRGFLQAELLARAGGLGLGAGAGTAAALAVTSVVFGALHALTPLYFWLATAAGALLGVECLLYGLPAAAATHFLYDLFALFFALQEANNGPLYRAVKGALPTAPGGGAD